MGMGMGTRTVGTGWGHTCGMRVNTGTMGTVGAATSSCPVQLSNPDHTVLIYFAFFTFTDSA